MFGPVTLQLLTFLWDSEVLCVAFSSVQVASIGANFKFILISPFQGAYMSLEFGHADFFSCPVRSGRQNRAIEHLKAIQVVWLGWDVLGLGGSKAKEDQTPAVFQYRISLELRCIIPPSELKICWTLWP